MPQVLTCPHPLKYRADVFGTQGLPMVLQANASPSLPSLRPHPWVWWWSLIKMTTNPGWQLHQAVHYSCMRHFLFLWLLTSACRRDSP